MMIMTTMMLMMTMVRMISYRVTCEAKSGLFWDHFGTIRDLIGPPVYSLFYRVTVAVHFYDDIKLQQ